MFSSKSILFQIKIPKNETILRIITKQHFGYRISKYFIFRSIQLYICMQLICNFV